MFHKKILLLFNALIMTSVCFAQSLPSPNEVQSPNAATMQRFTDVPVNLFTGTPNISIPLHTLSFGGITVPLALNYHPGAVRTAQVPGWVGMGWNLSGIGIITRKINGIPDNPYGDPNTVAGPTGENPYYPIPNSPFPSASGSDLVNVADWDSGSRLRADYSAPGNGSYSTDYEADEFSFNVMGHSGTFYYCGTSLGWRVISDEDIKVTMNGLLSQQNVADAIMQYIPCQQPGFGTINPQYQQYAFSGFTLTMPDGTRFVFGGRDAIEFNSNYAGTIPFRFTESAWMLAKIIDVNNNEVNFTYQRTYPTVSLSFGGSDYSFSKSDPSGCSLLTAGYGPHSNIHSGMLLWPLYLSQISSPNETITFNIGVTTSLRFSDNALKLIQQDGDNTASSGNLFNPLPVNNNVNNIQWEQLNNIVIKNNSNKVYRQYNFAYSGVTTQRSTLNGMLEFGSTGGPIGQYTFLYNNAAALPLYDGDYADHWGFYNAVSINNVGMGSVPSLKQTNPTVVTTGLLTQITYPTKGYVQLSWEAHDYQQVVATQRNALNNVSLGYAGGSRISEIKSFDRNGAVLLDKKYYYKRGYIAGVNVSTLTSSGILNGTPQYIFNISNRPMVNGTATASLNTEGVNSLNNYSYNGLGSHVGYDEVAEVNADGSYTKHFFTSYGNDLNGVSHWDIMPGYVGWDPTHDNYFPMSTLELERGKPVGDFQYSSANILVQKTITTYRSDAARFNNFVKKVDFNTSKSCNNYDALLLVSARKIFGYSYYPVNKTVTNYDQAGNSAVAVSESYVYNSSNLITSQTQVNSRGETIVTTNKYPSDYTDATSQAMVIAHMLSQIIEKSESNNGTQFNLIHTNYYSPYTGVYMPQTVQTQTNSNPLDTRRQFYNYDTRGNIWEFSVTNDAHVVFLYGYNSQYMVAKITNSTYTQVQQAMTTAGITQAQLDNAATMTDDQLRALLGGLRIVLPNSQVTTYTYAPVFGMTSMTDPKANTIFYEYDTFGRLMNTKDNNNKITRHSDYVIQ